MNSGSPSLTELFKDLPEARLVADCALHQYSTFRSGGTGDLVFFPQTAEEIQTALQICHRHDIPYQVLGLGSNVLISDRGIRGLTIILSESLHDIRLDGNCLYAAAGISLTCLAAFAAKHQLSGLEFACGIPGTIGGAILMNAGAYEGQIKDVAVASSYLDESGKMCRRSGEEQAFSYRHSYYSGLGGVIVEAEFELRPDDRRAIYARMNDYQIRRRRSQPLELASAGSAFKRPEGYFAGKLIGDSGLRGYRTQHAGVAEKHAGFIVNYGRATSAEINQVFRHVKQTVLSRFGIALFPEVKWIGDWQAEEIAWIQEKA